MSLESILCVELLAALRAGEGPWIAVHQLHVFALHRTGLESRATHFAEERSRRRMDCLMFHEVGVGAEHLVALRAGKGGSRCAIHNALWVCTMREVVLTKSIGALEGLPTSVAQEGSCPTMHIVAMPYQMLLSVGLIAALATLMKRRARRPLRAAIS